MLIETDIFGVTHDKVQTAIERIKCFEPPEGYYVAFSGGKDSVVILDLVKRSGVKYDAHYNITGIDPPELYYFIRDGFPDVQRHRPETTIWKLIEKKGFPPTSQIRYCCEYLKERGGVGRRVVTGVRWAESKRRKSTRKMVEQCLRSVGKTYLNPIIDWEDSDIWDYIRVNNLPYCSLYNEGFKRLGCVICPLGTVANMIKEAERWPRFKAKYIRAFQAGIEKHGMKATQKTGEEMFAWWLKKEASNPYKKDQTVMFE